jgi:16S rRNA (uracil1498-N3)-methyltransferase
MKTHKIHWFLVKDLKIPLRSKSFEGQAEKDILLKDKDLLHQFNRVLKFKVDERVVLFDGKGNWAECKISNLQKRECTLKVLDKHVKQRDENKLINLYFGIPKKAKFELVLEKGTEVGVTDFHPIITDRTEKLNIREDRAERILVEASEQSENPILPQLSNIQKLEDVIQDLNAKNTFVFHTEGEVLHTNDFKFFGEVNILIGPEGGWSPDEIQAFKDKGFKIYKVGESVLKTETACITIPFLFSIN